MQNTSSAWKAAFLGQHVTMFKAVIAGETYEYPDIKTCDIHRFMMDTLSIGNAASSTLDMVFYPKGPIPRAAKIETFIMLNSEQPTTAIVDEVNNVIMTDDGYPLASTINETSEWIPFGTFYIDTRSTDRDTGVMTIFAYDGMMAAEQDYIDEEGSYPMQMETAARKIAQWIGVEFDERSNVAPFTIDYPAGLYSYREILRYIGAASGGNWVITENNRLRLVPIRNVSDPVEYPAVSVDNVGDPITIRRVTLFTDNNHYLTAGNDSGYEISADCPFATQELVNSLLDRMRGVTYTGVVASSAFIDPAHEIGDSVSFDGIESIIADMSYYVDVAMAADIESNMDMEVDHEYPYKERDERKFERELAETQTSFEKTAEEIIMAVKGKINAEEASSMIKTSIEGITLSATAGENSSTIYVSADGITFDTVQVEFSNIVADSIDADNIRGSLTSDKIDLFGNMSVYEDDTLDQVGGWVGWAPGKIDGGYGIHMATDMSEFIATSSGARMSSGINEFYVSANTGISNGSVGMTVMGDRIVFNGDEFYSNPAADLGTNSAPWNNVYYKNSLTKTSDRRKKHEIADDVSKYDELFDKLHAILYDWNDDQNGVEQAGFYAQDVEQALVDCGIDPHDCAMLHKEPTKDGDYSYGLDYEWLIPILVDRIQKLEKRIDELGAK